jgi:hypothetical protein
MEHARMLPLPTVENDPMMVSATVLLDPNTTTSPSALSKISSKPPPRRPCSG